MRGRWSGWMVVFTAILLMGCASNSAPPAYYGLQAIAVAPGAPSQPSMTIGVGPVNLPDYLDRSAIVTRISPNRFKIHGDRRWAGALHSEILRVLAANIKTQTGSRQVVVFPWGSEFEPDIRFRIDIHAFEGETSQSVRLNATWSMTYPSSDKAKVVRDSEVVEKISSEEFEALTEAMGRALSVMSHEMVSAIGSTGKPVARDTHQ